MGAKHAEMRAGDLTPVATLLCIRWRQTEVSLNTREHNVDRIVTCHQKFSEKIVDCGFINLPTLESSTSCGLRLAELSRATWIDKVEQERDAFPAV